jgi:hypothetical protein
VSKEALATKLAGTPDETGPVRRRVSQVKPTVIEKAVSDKVKTEEHLMALALMKPSLRSVLYQLDPDMFTDDDARHAFEFLAEHPDFDGSDQDEVQQIAEYAKILSLVYETLYQDVEPLELRAEANRLQAALIHQYVRMQKQTIAAKLQNATAEDTATLLEQVRDLDALLRTNQGDASGTQE